MQSLVTPVAVTLGVFVLAGALQALTGFGSALVAVPALALILDPVLAVVVTTVCSLGLTAVAAHRERAYVERRTALHLTIAGLVAMPFGGVALVQLGAPVLTAAMCVVLVLTAALVLHPVRIAAHRVTTWTAGATSGVLLTSTGMNGPPLLLALSGRGLSPREVRATLQACFCVQDACAVGVFIAVGALHVEVLPLAVAGIVGSLLGWRIGNHYFTGFDARTSRRVAVASLLTAATTTGLGLALGWVT